MQHDENQPRARRRTAPLAVAAGIALLTAACGGGGAAAGSDASPSPVSSYAKLVAYAQCMRSHGVPNFPDPSSNGAFNVSGINPNSPQVQAARKACKSLVPSFISGQSKAQDAAKALKFAQCMRSHGVPKYPDPSSDGAFHISVSSGVNPQSPTVQAAERACQSIMSVPVP